MQEYIDKYELELEKASKEGRSIPTELENMIGNMIYLGVKNTSGKNYYFYKDKETNEYYYDTDYSREFRKQLRENRRRKYV